MAQRDRKKSSSDMKPAGRSMPNTGGRLRCSNAHGQGASRKILGARLMGDAKWKEARCHKGKISKKRGREPGQGKPGDSDLEKGERQSVGRVRSMKGGKMC